MSSGKTLNERYWNYEVVYIRDGFGDGWFVFTDYWQTAIKVAYGERTP